MKEISFRDLKHKAHLNMGSAPSADPIEHFFTILIEACLVEKGRSIKILCEGESELFLHFHIEDRDIKSLFPHIYRQINFTTCCLCHETMANYLAVWHEGYPYCEKHAREQFE